MNPEIASLTAIQYIKDNGPLTSWETAVSKGVNCQWVVHEFVKVRLGINLPVDYMSKEIWEDPRNIFHAVNPSEDQLREGDILIVSRKRNANPKKLHLAICIDGENILHATSFDQVVSKWSLPRLFENYPVLWGVKRLRAELNNISL